MKFRISHFSSKALILGLTTIVSLNVMGQSKTKKPIYLDTHQPIAARVHDLLSRMTLKEKISQMGAQEAAVSHLGIQSYDIATECLHGVVASGKINTTVFPQAIALASTWDTSLVYHVATAISDEGRALATKDSNRKYLSFFDPVINIARDPRWGRTEETYGEDPFLVSSMGVAFIKGLQGNNPKYLKVVATPKHFVANNDDWARHSGSSNVDERSLQEYYLPAFKACITEGNAQSIMPALNALNGIPCTADKKLLTNILRNEWGFNGYVVSDAEGVSDLYENGHRYVRTPEEAAAVGVKAGTDVDLRTTYPNYLYKAVKAGLISEKDIDRSVARILTVKFRLGMFDPQSMVPYSKIPYDVVDSKQHRALALQTALKSIVLLKNQDNILPLSKDIKSVAVIGPNADICQFGVYSGTNANAMTPLAGIKSVVSTKTKILYAKGCGIWSTIQDDYLSHDSANTSHQGWKGEYFSNPRLSGKPVLVRTDKQINFNWRWGSPDNTIYYDDFSARWTATLTPPVTRVYQFRMTTDDGGRVYIDNKLLIDEWHDQSPTTYTASIKLEAGHHYLIRMEYYEHVDNACAHLGWDYEPAIKQAADLAKKTDIAIVVVGTDISVSSEAHDRSNLRLTGLQEDLIKQVYAANPKTIVVLVNGGPLAIDWTKAHIPGILEAWYGGEEGGKAIGDVLFGDYNPGGKLPITFYTSIAQLPPFYDYNVREGRTYMYLKEKPLFPFGYGLSYTRFKFSNLRIKPEEINSTGKVYITVDVKNIGGLKGDEVAQLYVRDVNSKIITPIKELEGFNRVTLNPGETKEVSFVLSTNQLAFYHNDLKKWMVNPGVYKIMIGSSSEDIRLTKDLEIVH
ncbi:MAG: glycoside hydrolase family 3 C-terminal domain-containing protein [Bacteroidales bacterium]|nr:glycoside hydrolase family 3 C-terminal domain-containing protein [Bacteroidales bacterium]